LALPEFWEIFMKNTPEDNREESPAALVRRLEIPFKNLLLLTRALTHRSYINEHHEAVEDNERLEFLGDAILDFVTGAWLYNRFPEMAEGALTRLRAALVGNQQLAEFARQIGLNIYMRLGRGEDESGGRDRSALLGSTFEALVGALFLDQGIPSVRNYVEPMLENAIRQIMADHKEHDPKSLLQEWAQSQGYGPPSYQTISTSGPDHDKTFEVVVIINTLIYGQGHGNSKRSAAMAAAKSALDGLGLSSLSMGKNF
jgi:ribonuclease-3